MSLMLRLACQPVLDDADLDAYHIELSNKQMVITTPCGKPLAYVQGVTFNKQNPTRSEIEYAAGLLRDWLARNMTNIETYLSALEDLQRFGEFKKPDWVTRDYRNIVTFRIHVEDTCTVTFDRKGNMINVHLSKPCPPFKPLPISKTEFRTRFAEFKKFAQWADLTTAVENALAKLKSCHDQTS